MSTRRDLLAPLTLALALALAGCAEESEPNGDDPAETASCENPDEGYALEYPADWRLNNPQVAGPCRVFDPEPFTLEEGTEIPQDLAVVADMEPVAIERMTGGDRGAEVLRQEDRDVAGHDAVLIETRATQDAPLQEPGTRTYRYLVPVAPERTFVLSTTDRGELAYEDKRRVVDAMIQTVRFTQPSGTRP